MVTLRSPGSVLNHRDFVQATDVTNIVGAIVGTAGYGQLIRMVDYEDATNYTNILGNKDTTNGRALKIQYGDHAGTPTTLATFAKAAIKFELPATIKQADLTDPGTGYTAIGARASDGAPVYFAAGGSQTLLASAADSPSTILTTQGDIIVASAANTASRLGIGTARQVLAVNSGATGLEYVASLQSLMTAQGDILQASAANTPARLGIGTARQTLAVNSGATALEYVSSIHSLLDATGSMVYASSANTPAKLAVGTTNFMLSVTGGVPVWTASPKSVLDATGAMLYASGANTLAKLAIGSDGDFLTISGGIPAWTAAPAVSLTRVESSFTADVALSNTGTFFDGPSVSLGAGTWLIVGHIDVQDTAGAATIIAKLWDGTTVEASGEDTTSGSTSVAMIPLMGIVSPAGTTTYKISAKDVSSTNGKILAACFGGSQGNNASRLVAVQLA
jgi:hypothetical protein